jgi:MFS family permease
LRVERAGPTSSQLLRPLKIRGFRVLFAAASVSNIGTLLAAVALTIDVKARTDPHAGPWVAGVLIVEFLPTIVIGLTLGPLLDRLSRRGLMVGADVVRAGVFAALPFVSSPSAIIALAAVAGVANGFFRPALYAGLPNLVPEEELPRANALIRAVENVSWALGPPLGGIVTAVWGPSAAYGINAVSFLVSALLLAQIPARLLQSATAISRGHWHDVGDGLRAVRKSRALVAVLITWSLAMVGFGVVNVGEIFLAKNTFGSGNFGYGVLYGTVGIGLVVGTLASAGILERFQISVVYGLSLALMGLAFFLAAISPNIWVAAAIAAIGGIGNGVAVGCNLLLVQRGAPDEVRGRALTVVMGANYVVLGLSMAVAGPLLDAVGARWAWGGAGIVVIVAGLLGTVLTAGIDVRASAPSPGSRPGPPPQAPVDSAPIVSLQP